jgi:hypothetical protein
MPCRYAYAYAFACVDCAGLTLRSLFFNGTTTFVHSSPNATVANCRFEYPSASRRPLGATVAEFDPGAAYNCDPGDAADLTFTFVPSTWVMTTTADTALPTRLTFVDNYMWRSEGAGLYCRNCENDCTCAALESSPQSQHHSLTCVPRLASRVA